MASSRLLVTVKGAFSPRLTSLNARFEGNELPVAMVHVWISGLIPSCPLSFLALTLCVRYAAANVTLDIKKN